MHTNICVVVEGKPVQLMTVRPRLTQLTIGPVATVHGRLLQVGDWELAKTAISAKTVAINMAYKGVSLRKLEGLYSKCEKRRRD